MTAHQPLSQDALPCSIEAEQALLGALLLAGNAAAPAVALIVDREHFVEQLHQLIYGAILDAVEADRPVDVLTIGAALSDVELPAGAPPLKSYLAHLAVEAVTIRDAPAWAMMIRDLAHRREIMAHAREMLEDASRAPVTTPGASILDAFGEKTRHIQETRTTLAVERTEDLAWRIVQEAEKARAGEFKTDAITTGFPNLDQSARYRPGDVVVTAGRPGQGKSVFAACTAARIAQAGHGVLEFPFEIGREQAICRHLADLAYDPRSPICFSWVMDRDLRSAEFVDRIGYATRVMSRLPLEIDDSERMTVTRISARVQQAKANFAAQGVQLAYVSLDHLDFIQATDRYAGNRTQEIGEIMIGLKAIARREKIVMHVFSQLNRVVESREDKRPQLSDIRNCLPGSAMVLCADTGRRVPIKEIVENSSSLRMTVGISASLRLSSKNVVDAWPTGKKTVYKVTTRTGRVLKCTAGHRLFGERGWTELQRLSIGDYVALPRVTPEPLNCRDDISEEMALLLGLLLGDGYLGGTACLALAPDDDADFFIDLGRKTFGLTPFLKKTKCGNSVIFYTVGYFCGAGKNPLTKWLRELSLWGVRGKEKFIPEVVFSHNDRVVASVLRGLFHSDGCYKARSTNSGEVVFCSISEELARGVQRGLTRLGIVSSIRGDSRGSSGYRPSTSQIWSVSIWGEKHLRRFAETVGFLGEKHTKIINALKSRKPARNGTIDRLPPFVNRIISRARKEAGLSHASLGWRDQRKNASRETALMVSEKLNYAPLRDIATSDILWDQIVSIADEGEEETFDLTVSEIHNFIVDDFFTHNSGDVEQVADIVQFLYRPAYYLEAQAVTNPDKLTELEEVRNKLEIVRGKVRSGRTGITELYVDVGASHIDGGVR